MSDKQRDYNCEIIQDLIPLYFDEVCSEGSRKIVKEHISECEKCKGVFLRLENTTYDDCLSEEKISILNNHAKKERQRSFKIGVITASILMIPIIVCLICNIAIGHALDWFFIVLTSLMVFASLTIVPLMVANKKFLWTLGSFVSSLELLLLTICIYTKGDWFFLASVPIIFGLSVIFMPYILKQISLPQKLRNKKGIMTMVWNTLWLFGIIVVCGFHTSYASYWHNAILNTAFGLTLVWSCFVIMRYFRCNKVSKAGLVIMVLGIFTAIANDVVNRIIQEPVPTSIFKANFLVWNKPDIVSSNINLLVGIISVIIGFIVFVIGIVIKKKK